MIIPRDGPNLGPRAAQGPFLKFCPSLTVVTMVDHHGVHSNYYNRDSISLMELKIFNYNLYLYNYYTTIICHFYDIMLYFILNIYNLMTHMLQ